MALRDEPCEDCDGTVCPECAHCLKCLDEHDEGCARDGEEYSPELWEQITAIVKNHTYRELP